MKYKPQLAQAAKAMPQGDDLVLEPKYDGDRFLAETADAECAHPATVDFYTRNDKVHFGNRFPIIQEELLKLFGPDAVLDGELICPDPANGRINNWGTVQSVVGSKNLHPDHVKLVYVVFDVLALGGHDARSLPLKERRKLMENAFKDSTATKVMLTPQYEATQEMHDRLVEAGWEGSIIKQTSGPYRSGKRGYGWFKLKPTHTVEGVITGFQDGKNGFSGMVGAIEFGQWDMKEVGGIRLSSTSKMVNRGKVSGFDMKLREDMTKNPDKYIGRVIEVTHEGVTKDQRFRFPRFCRFRDDKNPGEVTWHDE